MCVLTRAVVHAGSLRPSKRPSTAMRASHKNVFLWKLLHLEHIQTATQDVRHTHSHTPSLSHTHTHTLCLPHTHTHSVLHTHTHTHRAGRCQRGCVVRCQSDVRKEAPRLQQLLGGISSVVRAFHCLSKGGRFKSPFIHFASQTFFHEGRGGEERGEQRNLKQSEVEQSKVESSSSTHQ